MGQRLCPFVRAQNIFRIRILVFDVGPLFIFWFALGRGGGSWKAIKQIGFESMHWCFVLLLIIGSSSLWPLIALPCPIDSFCLNGGTCKYYEAVGELVCQYVTFLSCLPSLRGFHSTWFERMKNTKQKNHDIAQIHFFFFFVLSSSWPPISWMEQTKNPWHWFDFKIFWFGLTSLPFLNYRCAEGYKGQRCENKDIYNLGSKSSVWAF